MKVMILTDMEGVSGTEGRADSPIGNKVLGNGAQFLANEVNACVDGLRAAGADEILVWDCHGGGRNMDTGLMRPGVKFCMTNDASSHMAFLDASFDATVQIGCHAKQGELDGYLNHTRNSHGAALTALNGIPIGEPEFGIFRASFFNVPTILVAGDCAACRDALKFNGEPLETVVCKRGLSRYCVIHRAPDAVLAEIKAKSEKALRNLSAYKPVKINGALEMTYRCMCPNQARGFIMRGCEMLDDVTVRLTGSDAMDFYGQLCGWAQGVHNKHFNITPETKNLF